MTRVLDGLPLLKQFETTDDDGFPQPTYISPSTSYFHHAIYSFEHVKEAGGVTALFFSLKSAYNETMLARITYYYILSRANNDLASSYQNEIIYSYHNTHVSPEDLTLSNSDDIV